MTLYLFGNLLGRLVGSYVLVWLLMFCIARFDWRRAFALTRKWYGIAAVAAIFALGTAVAVVSGDL